MQYLILSLLLILSSAAVAKELPFDGVYAAKVVDLHTGETVFSKNADLPLIPASNQKLITLYSALQVLDVEEQVGTSVYYSGDIKKGTLNGNIYFKFRGDPELDQKKLQALVQAISDAGIKKINGDVIVDDTEFDDEYFGHGWPVDQTKFCYSAPISSIIYNRNCYNIAVNVRSSGELDFSSEQKPYVFEIINNAKQVDFDKFCDLELKANEDNSYFLSGCYQAKNFPATFKMAVQNPRKNIMSVISNAMRDKDVMFNSFAFNAMPAKATELASTTSRPIKELLFDMAKDSDNMYAEIIFKKISARATGYSGSWKNSAIITKDLLVDNLGLNPRTFNLHDGSGLSRKNLIAPSVFTALLVHAYEDKNITQYFMDSLPIASKDGTLKGRFKDSFLQNKIFAKTGTVDNASTLSGYAFLDNGKKYAFSIMVNNYTVQDWQARQFQEKLLEHVFSNVS